MDSRIIVEGLITYLGLIVLLTFHEYGHAWMAWKCGDDTARLQGRCSLNPLVHLDPIGTVVLPLLMIFLSLSGSGAARFLVGWAKPVPVNPLNLRNPRGDDILVSMAGPWMNLFLAIVLMGLARVGMAASSESLTTNCAVWIHRGDSRAADSRNPHDAVERNSNVAGYYRRVVRRARRLAGTVQWHLGRSPVSH